VIPPNAQITPLPPDPSSFGSAGQFASACGAVAPIDLRIDRADGVLLAEGHLDLPCGVIGSDSGVEVTLSAPEVSQRHAALQVVGGRVLVTDLGSRTGIGGPAGRRPFAWLGVDSPVEIGPFRLTLRGPVADVPPTDTNPLAPDPAAVAGLPRAVVLFLSGRSSRPEWAVNRLVTFVGQAPGCKISLVSDDVAGYHCSLVFTPTGLWVVDLHAPVGVTVNGTPVRYARLAEGDELHIGRFRLGVRYPDGDPVRGPVTK
jgi:pSer/pThr/pTyr-binding forkhead associated (FHA) protein